MISSLFRSDNRVLADPLKEGKLTFCIRLGKLDQCWRQNLGHASDARRDDKESGAGRFEDPDPERFRQRRVQEDLSARENLGGSGTIVSTLYL